MSAGITWELFLEEGRLALGLAYRVERAPTEEGSSRSRGVEMGRATTGGGMWLKLG